MVGLLFEQGNRRQYEDLNLRRYPTSHLSHGLAKIWLAFVLPNTRDTASKLGADHTALLVFLFRTIRAYFRPINASTTLLGAYPARLNLVNRCLLMVLPWTIKQTQKF
jgi:hypothetical protein